MTRVAPHVQKAARGTHGVKTREDDHPASKVIIGVRMNSLG
jgi:hypothetical protein